MTATALLLYVLALHTSMAGMEIFGWILFLFGLIGLFYPERKPSLRVPLDVPILIYVGFCLLSIAITKSPAEPFLSRIADLTWIFTFWGVTKCLQLVWSEDFEKKALITWFVGLFAATGMGIYQYFSGFDFIRQTGSNLPQVGDYFRSTGFFSLCLTFAYSMGISGFSSALSLRKINRYFPYFAVLLAGACIFNSMTRGAWVSFIFTLVIMALFFVKKLSFKQIITISAFVLIYGLVLTQSKGGEKRIEKLVSTQTDEAVSERFDIWKAYLQIFKDNPVAGVGFNEGPSHLLKTYEKLGMDQTFVSHAHNDYLQVLAETGVIGLLAYLFLLGSAFWMTFKLMNYRMDWSISLMAGQLFISIGSLSQANFTDAEVNHFMIFNWALVAMLHLKQKKSSQQLSDQAVVRTSN